MFTRMKPFPVVSPTPAELQLQTKSAQKGIRKTKKKHVESDELDGENERPGGQEVALGATSPTSEPRYT